MNPAPDLSLAVISQIKVSVAQMLMTHEVVFLRIGRTVFFSFLVMQLSMQGLQWMYAPGLEGRAHALSEFLMKASTCLLMVVYYEQAMPGIGISFSNLVTDSAGYLMQVLDARGLETAQRELDALQHKFTFTDLFSIYSLVAYYVLWFAITIAKLATIGVVSWSLIASAVCALVGPLFVAFLIAPGGLEFFFWGWFKSFVQYSFVGVLAQAYMGVGSSLIAGVSARMPNAIDDSLWPIYGVQAIVLLGVFAAGVLSIPFLAASIFSGHAHHSSAGTGVVAAVVRKGI
jgi:hypothetical protein